MEEPKQPTDPTPAPPEAGQEIIKNQTGITKKNKALFILLIIAVIGLWTGISWWIKSRTHIETDNAFVEARTLQISFRVPGTVKRVLVHDNQLVKKGELLLELDDSDYRVLVNKAEASVAMAINETGGEHQQVAAARATAQLARVRLDQAVLDLQRGEALFGREVIAKEQLDRLKTGKLVAESQLKEAEETLKRAEAVAGLSAGTNSKPRVQEKQALLEESRLRLSYTHIKAPCDGYITRKNVESGTNIQAGQPLMALVPLQDAWITANYKEGQLTYIKPGQKVEFTVDAYPGRTFTGRVDSIMAGTGAAFSLLPPENATGNYVKVVQRVPVKIYIDNSSDQKQMLRTGMSVVPTVLTGMKTSEVLRELNPFK